MRGRRHCIGPLEWAWGGHDRYQERSGRSALGEAEMAGWDEGERWFVEVMKLDEDRMVEQDDEDPSTVIEVETVSNMLNETIWGLVLLSSRR